jgi:hypothetical protein
MNSIVTQNNDEARSDMDELLHDYFQAEMPNPWPTFKAPRTKTVASSWSRVSGRLALAACVGLLVLGYLTLGGFFPRNHGPSDLQKAAEDIGSKERKTVRPQTPSEDPMPSPMGVTPK